MFLVVFFKEAREVAVVTLVGRLFHARVNNINKVPSFVLFS